MIAHKGSVYTLDWHPEADEKNTLATGGRDNMVKVFNCAVQCCCSKIIKFTFLLPSYKPVCPSNFMANRRVPKFF